VGVLSAFIGIVVTLTIMKRRELMSKT
jgi:hypothetical protein